MKFIGDGNCYKEVVGKILAERTEVGTKEDERLLTEVVTNFNLTYMSEDIAALLMQE